LHRTKNTCYYLITMETINKPALLQDESESVFEKNIANEHFQFKFTNRPAPEGFPERNDNCWPKIYDLKKSHFEITIKPENTPYWRFGFRYSKTGKFPHNAEVRHSDISIADIHICVGDMSESRKWVRPNKMYIQSYHVAHKHGTPSLIEDKYKGEEITLISSWNPKTSLVHYQLKCNGKIAYENAFELGSFNYCVFGAWSDCNEYALATDIKVLNRAL